MEQLHSAWGLLFIVGLFAVELGYNVMNLGRKKREQVDDSPKLNVAPHIAKRTRQRSRAL